MMAKTGRVVAELGRPETPDETAARKAEFSKNYRNSQSFRNLIAALIATLAVLVVIVLIVPRGDITTDKTYDSVAIAGDLSASLNRPIYAVSALPEDWQTNDARSDSDGSTGLFRAVYSPDKDSKTPGFINLEQAFNTDADRAAIRVPGATAGETVTVDGWEWTQFNTTTGSQSQNVTYALGTQVGDDFVMLYGNADDEFFLDFAANLTAQFPDEKDTPQ